MTTTPAPALTPKQQQVLDLLQKGKTPSEISKRLNITTSGVYAHIRNMKGLGVTGLVGNELPVPAPPSHPAFSAPVAEAEDKAANGALDPSEVLQAAIDAANKRLEEVGEESHAHGEALSELEGEAAALHVRIEKLSSALGALA